MVLESEKQEKPLARHELAPSTLYSTLPQSLSGLSRTPTYATHEASGLRLREAGALPGPRLRSRAGRSGDSNPPSLALPLSRGDLGGGEG